MKKQVVLTTQIYLEKDNKYLMLLRNKKEHDINEGKWIGVGGHMEKGESPLECVIREVKEETGLTLNSALLRAKIYFTSDDYDELIYQYTSSDFSGEVIECNEGVLKWVPIKDVLSLPTWEGDKYFLEPIINNEDYFEISLAYKNNKLVAVERK